MPIYTITITHCYHFHIDAEDADYAIDAAFEAIQSGNEEEAPVVEHSILEGGARLDDCRDALRHLHKY